MIPKVSKVIPLFASLFLAVPGFSLQSMELENTRAGTSSASLSLYPNQLSGSQSPFLDRGYNDRYQRAEQHFRAPLSFAMVLSEAAASQENFEKFDFLVTTIKQWWPNTTLVDDIFMKYSSVKGVEAFLGILQEHSQKVSKIDFTNQKNIKSFMRKPLNELGEFLTLLETLPVTPPQPISRSLRDNNLTTAARKNSLSEGVIPSSLVRSLSNKSLEDLETAKQALEEDDFDISLNSINAFARLESNGCANGVINFAINGGMNAAAFENFANQIYPSPQISPDPPLLPSLDNCLVIPVARVATN